MERIPRLLKEVLDDVFRAAGRDFGGTGVIVCNEVTSVPATPLSNLQYLPDPELSLGEALIELGRKENPFHDGFHLLSPELRLIRPAMYFSPPIQSPLLSNKKEGRGGRYMAAMFGSALPGVICTGIVSTSYGTAVFINGIEV